MPALPGMTSKIAFSRWGVLIVVGNGLGPWPQSGRGTGSVFFDSAQTAEHRNPLDN